MANDPWFPSHPERDTYTTLLQQDPPASGSLLKAALLRRAVADVQRILRIREDKQALNNLLQKGSISDDLWARFLATEREVEAEIVEVVTEANTFREGWGQIIFQSASEIVQNERTKTMYAQLVKLKAQLGELHNELCHRLLSRSADAQGNAGGKASAPSTAGGPRQANDLAVNGSSDSPTTEAEATKLSSQPSTVCLLSMRFTSH